MCLFMYYCYRGKNIKEKERNGKRGNFFGYGNVAGWVHNNNNCSPLQLHMVKKMNTVDTALKLLTHNLGELTL